MSQPGFPYFGPVLVAATCCQSSPAQFRQSPPHPWWESIYTATILGQVLSYPRVQTLKKRTPEDFAGKQILDSFCIRFTFTYWETFCGQTLSVNKKTTISVCSECVCVSFQQLVSRINYLPCNCTTKGRVYFVMRPTPQHDWRFSAGDRWGVG